MKAPKMSRKTRKIASGLVCIVTALSLVFLQTPMVYAAADTDALAQTAARQVEAGADAQSAHVEDAAGHNAFAGAEESTEQAGEIDSSGESSGLAEGAFPEDGLSADMMEEGASPAADDESAEEPQPAATDSGDDKAADAHVDEGPAAIAAVDGKSRKAKAAPTGGSKDGVDVALVATKRYVDAAGGIAALSAGDFKFTLTATDDEGTPLEGDDAYSETVENDASGKVAFSALKQLGEGTYYFDIAEVLPTDAEQATIDGELADFWMAGDTVYDGSAHYAVVEVSAGDDGALAATVTYDGDPALAESGPVFTNRHISAVEDGLEFKKYYYGGNLVEFDQFSFVLEALANVDEAAGTYEPRGASGSNVVVDGKIADDGVRPFTIETVVGAGAFAGTPEADFSFPEIRFVNDGSYYYAVYEGSIDYAEGYGEGERAIAEDPARYLVRVDVSDGKVAGKQCWLIYGDDVEELDLDDPEEFAFYNNAADVVEFDDAGSYSYLEEGASAHVHPRAQKLVNGQTSQVAAGQFAFELLDDEGAVLATAVNDEDGDVAFSVLTFTEPGKYSYQIRENEAKSQRIPDMTYDKGVVELTVDVVRAPIETEDGAEAYALVATTTYAGPNQPEDLSADYGVFNNLKKDVDLRVQKVSSDTGEGLAGCTYALWMKTDSGDVMVAEADSSDDGWILFEDVENLQPEHSYYFKEVAAPSGYTVDPYRSDYFEASSLVEVSTSQANVTLDAPVTVADDPTRLEVAKLDKGTHGFAKGAKLAIVEKASGAVVDEWTSGDATHELRGVLDVDTAYILQEVSAPSGYSKADNVEFRLKANGVVELSSGSAAEKAGDYRIDLYDSKLASQTVVHKASTTRTATPRTGDETPLGLVVALVAAAVAAIGALHLAKRRLRQD